MNYLIGLRTVRKSNMVRNESERSPIAHYTSRGIVAHNGSVLFIERYKSGAHYYSLPGGHINEAEDPTETVQREIAEETTINVKVISLVIEFQDLPSIHKFYRCKYINGQPVLPKSSEEHAHTDSTNSWAPLWIPINQVASIPFGYWEPIRNSLIHILNDGRQTSVEVVIAKLAR